MSLPGRLVGFDYLRAFFSVCVVAVHLGYVFPSSIARKSEYESHQFDWSDFINFYVLCLAVPVFILISAYLYALKPARPQALFRRLGRIGRLLLFWSLLFQIFFFTGYGALKMLPTDPDRIALYLVTGGETVYYFFVSLLLITIVTHFAMQLPTRAVWVQFIASTALVGIMPILHRETGIYFALHANPLNFLPLAYAGIGLTRAAPGWLGWLMLALAAATSLLDWTVYVDPCFFEVNRFAIPVYTRPSLIFLAVGVVVLALNANLPENIGVRFMARHSLGVYCLHPFFVPVRYSLVEKLHLTGVVALLLPLAVVLTLSYLSSIVLGFFLKDDLIR